jgi:hypothetical protein
VEAKIEDILTNATCRPHIGLALMRAAQDLGGADDVAIPQRTDVARAVDFRAHSAAVREDVTSDASVRS